ncbi:MAG: hypothetical protein KF764_27670 [Labilithrix sp.]|nr:hypothetical protein [Labilithrix sp.]
MTVVLGEVDASSVAGVIAALPDPASLPAGKLVIVLGELGEAGSGARAPSARSFARSVMAVFRRTKTVTRARRCSALVARGYVGVGAADDELRADLAWGYAPPASAPEGATPDDVP